MGAWARVEAWGVATRTRLNHREVPFLWLSLRSFIWPNLTVGFWMYLDNTIVFFSIKERQKREQGKGVWQIV